MIFQLNKFEIQIILCKVIRKYSHIKGFRQLSFHLKGVVPLIRKKQDIQNIFNGALACFNINLYLCTVIFKRLITIYKDDKGHGTIYQWKRHY